MNGSTHALRGSVSPTPAVRNPDAIAMPQRDVRTAAPDTGTRMRGHR